MPKTNLTGKSDKEFKYLNRKGLPKYELNDRKDIAFNTTMLIYMSAVYITTFIAL